MFKLLKLTAVLLTAFLLSSGIATAQQPPTVTVTGIVTNSKGDPIGFASIVAKSSAGERSYTTFADSLGKFSFENLPVKGTYNFEFSAVGYQSRTITGYILKSEGNNAVIVSLKPGTDMLKDVVVVGYGTKQRKDLTSSVSSVSGDVLRKAPVATIDQALQGRAAGVQVTSSTGDPGGQISVRIRGISTASPAGSSEPLYVVDDIIQPNGISFLNPNDIESIDILKDAAALSIYGVRSANGVVLIKTKKGTSSGKVRVTVDGFTGVSQVWKKMDVLNIQEKATLNTNIIRAYNEQFKDVVSFVPIAVNPEWATPQRIANLPGSGTNWQDQVFHTGKVVDGSIGVSGGDSKSTYYFSVGHRKEDGTMVNSGFQRTSLRANAETNANKWLKVGITLGYSTSNRKVVAGTNDDRTGFMQSAVFYSPDIPVYGSNGEYGVAPVANINWYGNIFHPVNTIQKSNPKYTDNNLSGSVFGQVKLPFGITFRSTFAAGQYSGSYSVFNGSLVGSAAAPVSATNLYAGQYGGHNWNWDNYATWSKWLKGHSLELTAGYVAQYVYNKAINYSQSNFSNQTPDFQQPGLGDPATISFPFTPPSEIAYTSVFGRLSYNYQEKYYLQITGRQDAGSPAYVTDKPRGFFPAASVKWRMAKEKFMEAIEQIDELSFRASYGEMGNIGNLAYPGYSLVKINSNYGMGGVSQNGISLGQYASVTGTGWERLRQTDIGLDLTAYRGRLNITLDWYNRITKGMRVIPKVRDIFGSSTNPPLINLAGDNIRNTGFEATVTYNSAIGKLHYSISANGSINKNEVISLGDMDFIVPPDGTLVGAYQPSRTMVGHPISAFYGFVYDGIYKSEAEIQNAPVDQVGSELRPGDIRYKDINGDKKINEDDRTIIGNPTPKYTYGINLNLSYENFDLSMLLQGVAGNKIYNYFYQQGTVGDPRYNEGINRLADVNKSWTPDNPDASLPRIAFRDYDNAKNSRFSSFWLQDGSYLRLKNVQIGYTVPVVLSKKMQIERIRLYVSASNLFTITRYKGFDPEIGINSTGYSDVFSANRDLQIGVDRGVYPQPRMLLFGLNVTF
ncbi:SusC/RagA family TonB-linked outer membrane protein [Pseudobacter ginsenosidimutans]|uniref:TonB-linked SusC/RagA family outer membrane protein n=1 Tax=Pseudobacter ginsenosidimutans TaxID=661488 RepID=A0A4Q7N678_9BACT|nr:SusC/RagA family TonB-linked outer membrane protein [Pseudobacter ginsenosidimutans]QEC45090.1 SusC/RagA family TonB-linked outer membrane protein [Pseudobacter ginsenosidimutans]RZS76586.1 TonB-linked SusC/RagA family outer membrane protein [Pseudobacter ginsenosidimutans]